MGITKRYGAIGVAALMLTGAALPAGAMTVTDLAPIRALTFRVADPITPAQSSEKIDSISLVQGQSAPTLVVPKRENAALNFPEPASAGLILLAAAGLSSRLRRRPSRR